MAGIVANMPTSLFNILQGGRSGSINPLSLILIVAAVLGLTLFICYMELAQRRILIQYPKRATQRGMQAERRSEEQTSELQSLMRISYAVFCWKKKQTTNI